MSTTQPPNTYGGLSDDTMPSTFSMTKNGVPSVEGSGSQNGVWGTGTSLCSSTSRRQRTCSSRS